MKVEELKEQARRHEQREEWKKAFDLYSAALRIQDVEEPPDITLFNRVGDIQTRLGQINGAVEQYEKAVELYLEAELPNNAIAICKKVLRNLPDRTIFFLRMGQIRAQQGFLTDARQNFLTYAERQTAVGDVESALNALIEFVDLSPEDVEIRQGLASQLESHGRSEEAIEQYQEVYRRLILMEREEDALGVADKLEELAPDLALPGPDSIREEAVDSEPEELVLESTSLGGLVLEDWKDDESVPLEGVEVGPGEPLAGGDELTVEELEHDEVLTPDDEVLLSDLGSEDAEKEGMSAASEEDEEDEEDDDLPAFDFELGDEIEEPEVFPSFGYEDVDAEILAPGGDPLPLLGFDDEGDEESLPLLAFGEEEAEEAELEGAPLVEPSAGDDALEAALEDASFEVALETPAQAEAIGGESPEVDPTPSEDHRAAADRGDMDLAIERVKSRIEGEPENVELHQRLVEYAFRKNDPSTLVSAYLELAACLARTEAPLKAKAIYHQVLSLSPGNEEALAGIRELDGTQVGGSPVQVASSEEYVDLGSMILGDDAEMTTRWQVAAEAPSGDDEADFAKMLGQFKDKVSEHVAADDVGAHHDLGTAYMEMGLFDEAVAEFQMALRASPDHLPTHEVMGRCWMEMNKPDMAIRALDRALNVFHDVEDDLIGIYYLMGRAQEDQGNTEEAVEFYEKVFSLDINFEDVTERLRALR